MSGNTIVSLPRFLIGCAIALMGGAAAMLASQGDYWFHLAWMAVSCLVMIFLLSLTRRV